MAIQKAKKTLGLSAEQLAERIGCPVTVAGAVIEQLGGVSEDAVDIARELAATMGGSSDVVLVPAAGESSPVPAAAQVSPERLKQSRQQAAAATVEAAATIGNATSAFMSVYTEELEAERAEAFRPAARDLAKRQVAQEVALMGKACGQLTAWLDSLDLFDGTELAGLPSAIDVQAQTLSLPSGS